jgi:ribonucleoside-diphosphate reductase alpha chain
MIKKYLAPGELTWLDIADRVSGIMQRSEERDNVFALLADKKFIPNSPTLISANKPGGRNLMACHVVHVEDSIDGILEAAKQAAAIFKSGGGIGFEMSGISPAGAQLQYAPGGRASGPVSFMQIYNTLAKVILEGGLRRAAMMATLNASHSDIERFITCKVIDGHLSNFNISVALNNGPDNVTLETWKLLCRSAYSNGEPGVVYLDHINFNNPLLETRGPIIAVNACSEQPLYNFGSCTLGHIVLPQVITKLGDYTELVRVARLGVEFLNRVIDVNHYPLHRFAQMARAIRNIGLGVMGWADLLAAHDIPFVSHDALVLADEIGDIIYSAANQASGELADVDGGYAPGKRRNAFLTTIAPTGHTARLAGVENSIYPPYAVGMKMTPDEHLNHVAVWQPHIDSAISYTISFPNDAPENIVDKIFRGAYERGVKVMSVYRDGSRAGQPCSIDGDCV